MQHVAVISQHLTIVANPLARTARVEVPSASDPGTFAVEIRPALTTDGWLVGDPTDDEPTWRASFAAALDEGILQCVRVLSERVQREAGDLAARERARADADICRAAQSAEAINGN
jgi:hypothetical protein